MGKKHLAICMPSLGWTPTTCSMAFSDLVYPLNYGFMKCCCYGKRVAEARNECVKQVLDTEAKLTGCEVTHLFWLDDDVIPQPGALIALMQRQKAIVSGVYWTKTNPGEPLIFRERLSGAGSFRPGQLDEVWSHGMGLTLVEMGVYRRLLAEGDIGVDEFGNPAWYRAYDSTRADTRGEGGYICGTEDVYFLDAAHRLGIKCYVDQSEETFGWHYDGNELRGYPVRQWEEWKTTQRVTWDTPEGPVVWKGLHV